MRKEHRTNNTSKDIKDKLEEEQNENNINKKHITKVKYKSKLETMLIHLEDNYNITETLDQLQELDNKPLADTEEETYHE